MFGTQQSLDPRASSSEALVFPVLALGSSQPEILAGFSANEQKQIQKLLIQLTGLAHHIGKNFTMNVLLGRPGENSCWNPNTGDIFIDPLRLLADPIEILRFITCHEGGHCRTSRPDLIPREIYEKPGFPLFYNYLEDPRVNNFLSQGDPGFREGQRMFYGRDLAEKEKLESMAIDGDFQQVPRYLAACAELLRVWFTMREKSFCGFDSLLSEIVVESLQEALPGAQKFWKVYCSKHGAADPQKVESSARYAHDILIAEVWPPIEALIDLDLQDEKTAEGSGGPSGEGDGAGGGAADATQRALAKFRKLDERFESRSEEREPGLAPGVIVPKAVLDDDFSEMADPAEASPDAQNREGVDDHSDSRVSANSKPESEVPSAPRFDSDACAFFAAELYERVPSTLRPNLKRYLDVLKDVMPLVGPLAEELAAVFHARARMGVQRGLSDGIEIDLDYRVQEIAQRIPIVESQAWMDYTMPTLRDYAVTLLVDLSGSMKYEKKIDETFKAVVLLSEVLFRLNVNFEVIGFNSFNYALKGFSDPFSDSIRGVLGGMEPTVHSAAAGFNNDGHALWFASERLQSNRAREKRLIVLSDGLPAPSPDFDLPRWELHGVVSKILKQTNQLIVGLGLGEGTGHVKQYYPYALSEVDCRQLVTELGKLLRAVMIDIPVYRNGQVKE